MSSQADVLSSVPPERSIAPGVFLTFGSKATILLLNALGTVVVARALGPEGRGAIAVAFSFALVLVQLGSFGLQSANPYFASRDLRQTRMIVLNTIWAAAVIGALLAAGAVIAKACFPGLLQGLDWPDVIVVAAGLPAVLAAQLLQSVFLAEGRMRAYNGIELTGSFLMLAGLVFGFAFLHFGVFGAIIVMVSANWGMALMFLILQRRQVRRFGMPDLALFRTMLKYGFRVYLTTLVAYLVGRINLILVDSYLGPGQAGIYSIGVAVAEGIHLLPSVVALNLFPRIARGGTFENSAVVFRTLCIVFGGLCLLTIPLAGPGINLLYGPHFSQAAGLYYWMLPGIFSYGMLNVLSYHFAGRGFPIEAVLVWIPGLTLNVAITAIFLPSHGAYVAALASSVAYIVVLALHMRLFAEESGGYRVLLPRPRELLALAMTLLHSARLQWAGH